VYRRLQENGLQRWLDEKDLVGGQEWEKAIPIALQASDYILIFFSRNSIPKIGYVQNEFKLALEAWKQTPEGMIRTIPVRLDNSEVPREFRKFQWIDLFDGGGFDRIIQTIRVGESHRLQHLTPLLNNSIGMEFVLIEAGTFLMGSNEIQDHDQFKADPVHQVTIRQPFYLGKYTVTQGQWEAVMGVNPSYFKGDLDRPVEYVSWDDTQQFIRRLTAKESGVIYRLPTEAEWEYACRAGSTTAYSFGDDPGQLYRYGWYRNNAGDTTHPVGHRTPNAWGLYDMHGNVWEWVQDWLGEYTPESVTDPQGPEFNWLRVLRGGGWRGDARGCQSAFRFNCAPAGRFDCFGFRLLRTAR
jgi:formylglycine-generating enzyme required for sulfatase activity